MKYRTEIDGLRALAVLPVILFHGDFRFFSGGFVGVDVFFVISGYLITSIIYSDIQNGQFSFTNFYERRARRLLPALYVVSFLSIIFSYFILHPMDFRQLLQSVLAVVFFSSNFFFYLKTGYFDIAAEQTHYFTWSLMLKNNLLMPIIVFSFQDLKKKTLVFYYRV